MKIVVIGANGQLGSEFCEQFSGKYQIIPLDHKQIEISDMDSVINTLRSIKPDCVINTAAYHNVPVCEKNPQISFQVNGIGALNLAKASEELNYKLIHFSTDYVFDGKKMAPYIESDPTNPLNIYALTKLNGEIFIQNNCTNYFIIRISGIYGKVPCRSKNGNFITTMINAAKERDVVKVVTDEVLTPTSVTEIVKNTESLIQRDCYGLYHMTCQGECSWYEFAKVIFKELELKTPLRPCSVSDFPMIVKRPTYSVLENQYLQTVGLNQVLHWKEALINFFAKH